MVQATLAEAADPDVTSPAQALLAQISIILGGIKAGQDKQSQERQELLNAIYPVAIPPQTISLGTSSTGLIASAELLGPRRGNVWDVRRVTVHGMGGTADSMSLYRVSAPSSQSAVDANLITSFTGTAPSVYGPGLGALLLRPNESLMLYGTSLTTAATITLAADAINVEQPWLGAYLL